MAAPEYTVLVEPHGRRITVPADRPILESALSAGLNLPHSCKSGHCASCRVQLRIGQVEYPNGLPLGVTAEEAAAGKILLCQARARSDLVVQARLIASVTDVEIKTLPCRIARVVPLAPDVMQVFLRLPVVERLEFQPGQYLDILLDRGRRRSFSIASPPHDSDLIELHVRRVPGGGFTDGLWSSSTGVGSLLRIEGPIGQFVYQEGSAPVLMIAGGTGFAPLKSMLRHVLERGIDRSIHLYWGARQGQDLYEEALVREWVQRYPQLRFTAVLSEATGTDHRAGWVHEAVLADYPNIESFDVYAAGPPAMVEAIKATFPRQDRLYFDSFDYAVDDRARASDTKPLA